MRYLLQRYVATSESWIDTIGIVGTEAFQWAETLVSMGNYRLVPVVAYVPQVWEAHRPAKRRRTLAAWVDTSNGQLSEVSARHGDLLQVKVSGAWRPFARVRTRDDGLVAMALVRTSPRSGRSFRLVRPAA